MALENVLVYGFTSGDDTYPHSGTFTANIAGQVTIDDSDGVDDALFGDYTHTGGADVPDQNVTASSVSGVNVGDTIDVRYKYTVTGSDGSSGTIYFIATNSTSNYGPLFVSDFQISVGVTYTFGTFNTDGAIPYSSLVPCFTRGTFIETLSGEQPIETIKEGDWVLTRDNGFQPVRWIGECQVPARGKRAPIRVAKGVLQNTRDLLVSPNHRMLIADPQAKLHFGETEVLVAAKHLTHMSGVSQVFGGSVTYLHLLFDQHQILIANETYSESFFPGTTSLGALEEQSKEEVLALFPELRSRTDIAFAQTARRCLNRPEAMLLQQIAA